MIRAAFQNKNSVLVWWVKQHGCIHWVECQGCVDPQSDHYSILTRSNAVLSGGGGAIERMEQIEESIR